MSLVKGYLSAVDAVRREQQLSADSLASTCTLLSRDQVSASRDLLSAEATILTAGLANLISTLGQSDAPRLVL